MPVSVPSDPTVAMAVLPLVHEPPPVASISVTVEAGQTGALPVIAVGAAVTVTVAVVIQALGPV